MSGVTCKPTGLQNGWLLELPGYTLPEANIFAPKNGMVSKYRNLLFSRGSQFLGDMLVSREGIGTRLMAGMSQCQVAGMVVHFELGMTEDEPDSGSTISTLLHDRINPKNCQVLSLGDIGFLQFFRVVSRDYGKPRDSPSCLLNALCVQARNAVISLIPWTWDDCTYIYG